MLEKILIVICVFALGAVVYFYNDKVDTLEKEAQEYRTNYTHFRKEYETLVAEKSKNEQVVQQVHEKLDQHDIKQIQEKKPVLYLNRIQKVSDDFINRMNKF